MHGHGPHCHYICEFVLGTACSSREVWSSLEDHADHVLFGTMKSRREITYTEEVKSVFTNAFWLQRTAVEKAAKLAIRNARQSQTF